jgi:hypothetical protein
MAACQRLSSPKAVGSRRRTTAVVTMVGAAWRMRAPIPIPTRAQTGTSKPDAAMACSAPGSPIE